MNADITMYRLELQAGQRVATRVSEEEFKHVFILDSRELGHHGARLHLAIRALRPVELVELPSEAALEWYRAQEAKPEGGVRW